LAKELPYFKFYPSEWVTGDITLCSNEAQGLFINMCSYYWMKNCTMTLANIKKRFGDSKYIDELIDFDIISIQEEKIIIKFLDEQMNEFIDVSEKRSKAGAKGGSKNSSWSDVERKSGSQLYVLFMNYKNEMFIKIGVTDYSISRRYSVKPKYKITTLYQYFIKNAVDFEIELQEKVKKYNYTPLYKYPGYLESYHIGSLNIVDDYFKQLNSKPTANYKQIISKLKQYREDKDKDNNKEKDKIKTNFEVALDNFTDMRKKIKKPLTENAKGLIVNKLKTLSPDEDMQIKILNQSTMNSWQGVFPIDDNKNRFKKQTGIIENG